MIKCKLNAEYYYHFLFYSIRKQLVNDSKPSLHQLQRNCSNNDKNNAQIT